MISNTSNAVNEAVEAMRGALAYLRGLQASRPLDADEVTQLISLTDSLAKIENNRGNLLIGAIAGRRGLDKLPPHELEQVVKALAGLPDEGEK